MAQKWGKGVAAAAFLACALLSGIVLAVTVGAGPPGTPTMLSDPSHRVGVWKVTPDGSTVVYGAEFMLFADAGIWTVPSDGAAPPVQLVAQARPGFTITPDGSNVVFQTGVAGGQELFVVPIGGGTPKRVSGAGHTLIQRVELAADGQTGVYLSWDGVNSHLWWFALDGRPARQLSTSPVSDPSAPLNWITPDGTHAVCRSGVDLFVVPVDGSASPPTGQRRRSR